jgi:IstB-like ATP binding protein
VPFDGLAPSYAFDLLLTEELTLRENRRVKMALQMARLSAIKTLAGFDFSFQPSLDTSSYKPQLAGLNLPRIATLSGS